MEPTDDMVEAALDLWFHDEDWRNVRDDEDHMPDRWRAEMKRALRAALAVMPDQYRAGWIAGRDAAREICRDVICVCDGDIDDGGGSSLIAQWRRDGASACFDGIAGLEPPA